MKRFRWKFSDDVAFQYWSAWHTAGERCTACCCGGGPDLDGEHREPAEYDFGYGLETGHSYCDPNEDEIEWEK